MPTHGQIPLMCTDPDSKLREPVCKKKETLPFCPLEKTDGTKTHPVQMCNTRLDTDASNAEVVVLSILKGVL